jgi:hypothetical protein
MEANASRINQISPGSDAKKAAGSKGQFVPISNSRELSAFNLKTTVVTKGRENEPPNVAAGQASQPSGVVMMGHFAIHIAQTHPSAPQITSAAAVHVTKPLGDPNDQKQGKNGKWSASEDNLLRGAVEMIGTSDYEALALLVPSRTARQIKDRWTQFLDVGLSNADLTNDEIKLMKRLLPMHVKNRKKPWALLAKSFPGRSSSILKNAWKRYETSQKPKKTSSKSDLTSSEELVLGDLNSTPEEASNELSITLPVSSVVAYLQTTEPTPDSTLDMTTSGGSQVDETSSSIAMIESAAVHDELTTAAEQLSALATPAKVKPRPKPFFSPNANAAPMPFTPPSKMDTYRASPYPQRQPFGQLDNSLLASPPPNTHVSRVQTLLSPTSASWRPMEGFEPNMLDASRTDPFAFPVDLQSSVILPDVNNASTDIPGHNWTFSDAWRV